MIEKGMLSELAGVDISPIAASAAMNEVFSVFAERFGCACVICIFCICHLPQVSVTASGNVRLLCAEQVLAGRILFC